MHLNLILPLKGDKIMVYGRLRLTITKSDLLLYLHHWCGSYQKYSKCACIPDLHIDFVLPIIDTSMLKSRGDTPKPRTNLPTFGFGHTHSKKYLILHHCKARPQMQYSSMQSYYSLKAFFYRSVVFQEMGSFN
jgi:hypothetical protein